MGSAYHAHRCVAVLFCALLRCCVQPDGWSRSVLGPRSTTAALGMLGDEAALLSDGEAPSLAADGGFVASIASSPSPQPLDGQQLSDVFASGVSGVEVAKGGVSPALASASSESVRFASELSVSMRSDDTRLGSLRIALSCRECFNVAVRLHG